MFVYKEKSPKFCRNLHNFEKHVLLLGQKSNFSKTIFIFKDHNNVAGINILFFTPFSELFHLGLVFKDKRPLARGQNGKTELVLIDLHDSSYL